MWCASTAGDAGAISAVLARLGIAYASFYIGTLVSLLAGVLFVGGIALVVDATALGRVSLTALGWFAFLGLVSFPMGRMFSLKAIQHIGVSRSAPIIGAMPLAAGLLALLIYGEKVTPLLALGGITVMVGVVLILRESE